MDKIEQLRHQQKWRETTAASARSLAADGAVHVRQGQFFHGNTPLAQDSPHVRPQEQESVQQLRGVADSIALALQYSDKVLHQELAPKNPIARLIFNWLECLRTEALCPPDLPGAKHNLEQRFYFWSAGFYHEGHTDSRLGILLYTIIQMCWSRLHHLPPYAETEDLIEGTRAAISAELGPFLQGLRTHKADQKTYAQFAIAIAELVKNSIEFEQEQSENKSNHDEDEKTLAAFALFIDVENGDDSGFQTSTHSGLDTSGHMAPLYFVFDTQYDSERHIAPTLRKELLQQYRKTITTQRNAHGIPFHILTQRVRHALTSYSRPEWINEQEEGLVDGRLLSQLISSPNQRQLFKQPTTHEENNCSVSFLIDCSGSMKHHAELVALFVDVLGQAIDLSGSSLEVLGFSTHAWNGGRPYKRWIAKGRKTPGGRMNELDLRIFKSSTMPWREAKLAIASLLKLDLYREGIDGEAFAWAAERLIASTRQRKLLYVISDGCPTDSATMLANDDNYLARHLHEQIQHYQQLGIEVRGIGIGIDLSQFYPISLIADMEQGLDHYFLADFIKSLYRQKA